MMAAPVDLAYAIKVLDSLKTQQAIVPGLWALEAANVVAKSESKGLMAEARTQAFVAGMERLSEVVKALDSPDIRGFFSPQGFVVAGSTPEQFKAMVEAEVTKWGRIVKAANVVAD